MNGTLVLSLAMQQKRIVIGETIIVGLQLSVVGDLHVDLLTNLPLGTYDVEVDDERTGKRLPDRSGYLVQISQIGIEHLSQLCPAYQSLDLNNEYDLKAGRYTVRAIRSVGQLLSMNPYKTQRFTVLSNDVMLEVFNK